MDCSCKMGDICPVWKKKAGAALITLCREGKLSQIQQIREHGDAVLGIGREVAKIGDLYAEALQVEFGDSWLMKLPGLKTGCQLCKNLQEQMNNDGIAICLRRRSRIIDATAVNASQLHKWVPATVVKLYTDSDSCRAKIASAFDAAIRRHRDLHNWGERRLSRRRSFTTAFRKTGTPQFITTARLQQDTQLLASLLPADVSAIAGIARSGISVAAMVAMLLHLPLLTVRQNTGDVIETGNGWRLGGQANVSPDRRKVAVIDDTCMTGNSLTAVEHILRKEFNSHVTATVYTNPLATHKPDIWAQELGWPHLLEWNLFNSVLSPNTACDFDGILCYDCPVDCDDDGEKYSHWMAEVRPLYVPRKTPIPLIVTARIERYRDITMKWLDKHNIKVDKLVMHPAKTLAERNSHDIAAFKARVFGTWKKKHTVVGPPPVIFVESDDRQAIRIARLAGGLVVCPATAGVYQ